MMITWSFADEISQTSSYMGKIEAPAAFIGHTIGDSEASNLERRILRIVANSDRGGGCPGCITYDQLQPTSPYDRITITRNTETPKKTIEISSKQVINTGDGTTIKFPEGWTPPIAMVEPDYCEFGDDSKCPPLVCASGDCKNNYVVIFASKKCKVCKRMWPIVERLRESGYIVFYLNTEDYPEVYKQFNLKMWPTIIVMNRGELVHRFNGFTNLKKITPYLKTLEEQGLTRTEEK